MTTKVQKWGNSLAVRLPKNIVRKTFKVGMPVIIKRERSRIIILPKNAPEPTLEELIAQIDPKNLPEKIDWGKPVGKEIW